MVTSILICTPPQYKYLPKILSVATTESDNVVVVYDAPPHTVPEFKSVPDSVIFIAAHKPFTGFGAGWCRDVGVKHAMQHLKQDRFVFIDGDCIPTSGSIAALSTNVSDIVIGTRIDVSQDGSRTIPCRTSTPGTIEVSDAACLTHSVLLSCLFSISSVTLHEVQELHRTWLGESRVFPSVFDSVWGGEDSALASAVYLLGGTFTQLGSEVCQAHHQYHDRTHTYTVVGLDTAVRYHGVLRARLGK